MKNKLKIVTTVEAIEETTVTDTIKVTPKIDVCKATTKRYHDRTQKTDINVREYVVSHHQEKYLQQFFVAKPALVDSLRFKGWRCFDDKDKTDELLHQKPFTAVAANAEPFVLVGIDWSNNRLYDAEGEALPVAMYFDDINGRVSNKVFNLEKLLKHLRSRRDITVFASDFNDTAFIQEIPYYNAGKNETHYLSFKWHPDVETYRKYIASLGSTSDFFERYEKAHAIMGNNVFKKCSRK